MMSARIFLLLSLLFVGGVVYTAVTRDLSPATLAIVGFLGLASLLLGFLIGRENPTALVHLLMMICTTVTIFAAIFWWYSRNQASAVVAIATAPLAIVFSGLTLRRRANRKAGPSSAPPHAG